MKGTGGKDANHPHDSHSGSVRGTAQAAEGMEEAGEAGFESADGEDHRRSEYMRVVQERDGVR